MMASKGLQAMPLCYLLGWSRLEVANHYVQMVQAKAQAKEQVTKIWG
jgi:hypothetical protein